VGASQTRLSDKKKNSRQPALPKIGNSTTRKRKNSKKTLFEEIKPTKEGSREKKRDLCEGRTHGGVMGQESKKSGSWEEGSAGERTVWSAPLTQKEKFSKKKDNQ